MNRLLEEGYISEMMCGANFAYTLEKQTTLMATAYKVLQSQTNSCFVRCMKMTMNGKVMLLYLTEDLRPLSALLPSLTPEGFSTIVSNLISDVMDVKNNGFLACRNIDISAEHIFVEPATRRVSLVYLPTDKNLFEDESAFENELRADMIRLIHMNASIVSPGTMQMAQLLSDGTLNLEELSGQLKSMPNVTPDTGGTQRERPGESGDLRRERGGSGGSGDLRGARGERNGDSGNLRRERGGNGDSGDLRSDRRRTGESGSLETTRLATKRMKLISVNSSIRTKIEISKDSFVIGKNETMADGAIPFNNMISRVHCRVNRSGDGFTVTDLGSTNGTFINRNRLKANQAYPVKDGDIVSLANSDFRVQIR